MFVHAGEAVATTSFRSWSRDKVKCMLSMAEMCLNRLPPPNHPTYYSRRLPREQETTGRPPRQQETTKTRRTLKGDCQHAMRWTPEDHPQTMTTAARRPPGDHEEIARRPRIVVRTPRADFNRVFFALHARTPQSCHFVVWGKSLHPIQFKSYGG